ncbi:MAG: DEAD/DEAH box helicase [Nitrospirae bacterium YQR-1]
MDKILNLLGKLETSSIYFLSSKEMFSQAFRLYEAGRVENIYWNDDKTILSLDIPGFPYTTVQIYENGGTLSYDCGCAYSTGNYKCKHIICAVITIKNLLNQNLFKPQKRYDERKRDYLLGLLFEQHSNKPSKTSKKSIYAIEFEYDRHYPICYLTVNDKIFDVTSRLPGNAPPDFKMFHEISNKSMDRIYTLCKNLHYRGTINFRHKEKVTELTFDYDTTYKTCVEFNYAFNKVFFKLLCIHDKTQEKNLIVTGDFVVNTTNNKIAPIKDTRGLDYWHQLQRSFGSTEKNSYQKGTDDDNILQIPLKSFQSSHFRFLANSKDDFLKEVLCFSIHENATELKIAGQPTYRILATEDRAGYSLTAEGVSEGTSFSPLIHPFDFFYIYMPAGLTSQKRRNIIYRTFIGLFSENSKKGKNDLIKTMINEETFGKIKYVREARNLLKSFIDVDFESRQLIFSNNQWVLVPIDIKKQMPLFSVAYGLYGIKIFEGIARLGNMWVEKEEFTAKLPALLNELKENGVDFLLNGQEVVLTSWDFEVNVTKKTIDWFEIKQEIRYHGNLISKQMLKEALNGVVKHQGTLHILDETTLSNLTKLSKLIKGEGKKEIVTIPRLQIFDLLSLRKSNIKVTLPIEEEEIVERLLNFEAITPKAVPVKLKTKLRQYQKDGYSWLSFLYEHRFGACLADDMGLGKTVQAITLLAAIKEGITTTGSSSQVNLIVVPPTLLFNWESELERFYPSLRIYLYRGRDRNTNFDGYDIVLTSYALIRKDIEKISPIRFNLIVFDEAQMIKNIYADTTNAVRKLNGHFKLGLTGTPLENHLGEYYSIMDLLLPGLLGQYRQYKNALAGDAVESLIYATRPFVLRRTKDKILKELPPKIESDVYLTLTESQKALYNKTVENVKKTIREAYENRPEAQAKIIALTALLRLRQVCLSSRLLLPEQKEKSPKIEFLANKTIELMEEGHSCLVFSQFTAFLDLIEARLREIDCKIFRLDGDTSVVKRKKIVEDFQSSEAPSIFLLSLKAGGQGLNLTRATYVFHMDPWWNPAVENQASDRAHRIGQKNKVIITRLLMQHTVEEKIMHLKKQKSEIYNAIMDPATVTDKVVLSKKDFEYILNVTA